MKTFIAAASILLMSGAAAFAAEDKATSSADAPAASGQGQSTDKMSPGTTGAMQTPANGVATTPDEVKKQGGMGVTTDGKSGAAGKEMGGGEKPK